MIALPYNPDEDLLQDLNFLTQRISTLPREMQIACWNNNDLPLVRPNGVTVTKCPPRNVSGGFRWNDHRQHRPKPDIVKKEENTLEDLDALADADAWATNAIINLPPRRDTSYDNYPITEIPVTSVQGSFGNVRRPRIPIGDLPQADKDSIEKWNKILSEHGLPWEPNLGYQVIRQKESLPLNEKPDYREATLKGALDGLWITKPPKPPDAGDMAALLFTYFRGATREEVRRDEEAAWLYTEAIDPEGFRGLKLTRSQMRTKQRKEMKMQKIMEGKCPTGTCGNDRCANPELSYAERQETHAANLKVNEKEFEKLKPGTWYVCVVLQGQPRIKILDIAGIPGASEEDRAEIALERLQAASPDPAAYDQIESIRKVVEEQVTA
jgi:hypothetical protein